MLTKKDPAMNALRHGGTAHSLFIKGENPDDYQALMDDAYETHKPADLEEEQLVIDFVDARWKLNRRQHTRDTFEAKMYEDGDPLGWGKDEFHKIQLRDRYVTEAERSYRRAFVNLQYIRKEKLRNEYWRERLAIQRQKIELEARKLEMKKKSDIHQQVADYQASKEAIQHDEKLGCSVIVQTVLISDNDGTIMIDHLQPPHHEVKKLIDARHEFANPPQKIVRDYLFLHNIPEQYAFVKPADFKRSLDNLYEIRHAMDFEDYFKLAAKENIIIATQPEPDKDDETLSDEEWLARHK